MEQETTARSKGLLQALSALKQGENMSGSLLAAMGELAKEVSEIVEEQFKLPDLVVPKVQKDVSGIEKELFIKPKKPVSKPGQYFRTHFDKQQIKQGATIQREQQMKKAEEALKSKDPEEEEAVQEIDEEEMWKEQLKKERAERQARRAKEREEEGQQVTRPESAETGTKGGRKPKKDKKDHKRKRKLEQAEIEEEEDEEREGVAAKKVCGCINPQEAEGFQNFVKSKVEELVDELKNMKDLINPVRKFIRVLKVEYDVIGLFESNGAANMEDIVDTILDTKGIAWQKALDGKEMIDGDEYNKIIDCCMDAKLFQEGTLHLELDEMIFGEETDEVKELVMQKCASLFENVEKAHQANVSVARDLKDLVKIVKDPEVFSHIAQAATQLMVACYTPRVDTFIRQQQVMVEAKQDKLAKCKSVVELMEMSNLPQYNEVWGDRDNKELVPTRYMAAIVWFFIKREMCGTAPNIANVADYFKVSRSQLSRLLTAKKFKSGPGGYVPKKKRTKTEGETSGATARGEQEQEQEQEGDEFEEYLLS